MAIRSETGRIGDVAASSETSSATGCDPQPDPESASPDGESAEREPWLPLLGRRVAEASRGPYIEEHQGLAPCHVCGTAEGKRYEIGQPGDYIRVYHARCATTFDSEGKKVVAYADFRKWYARRLLSLHISTLRRRGVIQGRSRPAYRPFNSINEPGTCFWCGRKLSFYPAASLDDLMTLGRLGSLGDSVFCNMRCGYDFAVDMAIRGHVFRSVREETTTVDFIDFPN